jgi:hypothetical protein
VEILLMYMGVSQYRNQAALRKVETCETDWHSGYTVIDADGNDIGINLLTVFYGDLWEQVLERVCHKIDGHLFALTHAGRVYDVYRKIDADDGFYAPKPFVLERA